jgi:hypothetical protein
LKYLSVSTGKFAVVFGKKIGIGEVEQILLQNEDFDNVLEIALFVPKTGGGSMYSIFGRSLENDKELAVLNIWDNGKYIWNTPVYPKGRMSNLKGATIKATSFQFPPFNYQENPENEDEEYQGLEVI